LHALKAVVEEEFRLAQAKKHNRIIIKPPVYHVTQSPLYRDMKRVSSATIDDGQQLTLCRA
jgi:hypothetical protein